MSLMAPVEGLRRCPVVSFVMMVPPAAIVDRRGIKSTIKGDRLSGDKTQRFVHLSRQQNPRIPARRPDA
jgi:hypothetical protein